MGKSLNMGKKIYRFDIAEMKSVVSSGRMGNYALGYLNNDGNFVPQYVGRSDNDLLARLISHVNKGESYKCFKFSYANNEKEAYEKECRNFHEFQSQLNNDYHPDKPDYKEYRCPVCGD